MRKLARRKVIREMGLEVEIQVFKIEWTTADKISLLNYLG